MTKQPSQKQQFWINHIKNHQQSNLTQAEYCKQHNINNKSFSSQKSQLSKNIINQTESLFLPLQTAKKNNSFSIKINNGMEIKFDSIPEPIWIAKLLNSIDESHDQY